MTTLSALFEEENIDLDFISDNFDGFYWNHTVYHFLESEWETRLDSMSAKQINWAGRILEDCVELRIERKL